MAKRLLDIVLSLLSLAILAFPMLVVGALVRLTSPGPALFWSHRIGRDNRVFSMPKFRSMRIGTPTLATHELENGKSHVTPFGAFIRRTSIDELPQLWCVLKGDMSIVGPRPALDSQHDLIALRTERGVHRLRPGLTGLAQIKGRDDLSITDKAAMDAEYLGHVTLWGDVRIIALTAVKVIRGDNVAH